MFRTILVALVAVVAVSALIAGCGQPKFSEPRYEAIWIGQASSEITDVMGKPTTVSGDDWIYFNKIPYREAVVTVRTGKVTGKVWHDHDNLGPLGRKMFAPRPAARSAPKRAPALPPST